MLFLKLNGRLLKIMKIYSNWIEDQLRLYFQFDNEDRKNIFFKKYRIEKEIQRYEKNRVKIISLKDKNYPVELKNISHPPYFYIIEEISLLQKESTIGLWEQDKLHLMGKDACEKITIRTSKCRSCYCKWISFRNRYSMSQKNYIGKKWKNNSSCRFGTGYNLSCENRKYWEVIGEEGLIISEYPLGTSHR